MAQNSLMRLLQPAVEESPEIAAAKLRGNQSLSGLFGRTSDLLAQDTDAYGRYDPRGGQQYAADTRAALADDPWAQHYENAGRAQSEANIYNLPEVAGPRQEQEAFELEKTMAPARLEGEYGLERQRIASGGQVGAAREAAAGRGQSATATRAGQLQRQRNQLLQQQANQARRGPDPWWFQRLFGAETPEQKAQGLTDQMDFSDPDAGMEDQVSDNPVVGETGVIQGTPVMWDGQGWAVIE